MPALERLYSAMKTQKKGKFEVVLVSWCSEAKSAKYYSLGMPWLLMSHDADDEPGMRSRTMALTQKFGIPAIPALVLLDKNSRVICQEARGWVTADPLGVSFPWRNNTATPRTGVAARAVVNFDLPAYGRTPPRASWAIPRLATRPPHSVLAPIPREPTGPDEGGGGITQRLLPIGATPTSAPDNDPPPNFGTEQAESLQEGIGLSAERGENVHARASHCRVRVATEPVRPPNPLEIVAADQPPDKPNLQFTPETIPQGELTLLMQPQPLTDVHPFTPTLQQWQQGIPVDCGPD